MIVEVKETFNEDVRVHSLGTLSHHLVSVGLGDSLELIKHVFNHISIETFNLPLGITLK